MLNVARGLPISILKVSLQGNYLQYNPCSDLQDALQCPDPQRCGDAPRQENNSLKFLLRFRRNAKRSSSDPRKELIGVQF